MADFEKNGGKAPKQRSWDWRSYFPVVTLKQGEMDEERGAVEDFRMSGSRKGASAKVRDFDCSVEVPSTYLECEEYLPWQKGLRKKENYGYGYMPVRDETNLRPDRRFSCNCTSGMNKNFCRHVAALLIHWEKTLGKFTFVETEEDIRLRAEKQAEAERKRREQEEEDRKRRKEEEERLRQRQEMEAKQKDVSPARNFYGSRMPRAAADVHFNPEAILKDVTTDRYELEIAEKLQANAASSAESSPETKGNTAPPTESSPEATANAASSTESSPDFTANAARWYQFILSRVREMNVINARIEQKTSSRYYYGGDATLSIGSAIPLEGSDLDLIYDMAKGQELLCDYGSGDPTTVRVGTGKIKASVHLVPARGKNNVLIGIDLKGSIPRFLQGNQYRYILDREQFGRVSAKELRVLAPYQKIADKDGHFFCRIGLRKFPEFYYRVLPQLRESEEVLLSDGTTDLKLDFLPPEGEYVFYIDYTEDGLSCRDFCTMRRNLPPGLRNRS